MLKLFSKKDKVKRPAKPFKKRAKEVLGRVIKSRELYLMIIPVIIFYIISHAVDFCNTFFIYTTHLQVTHSDNPKV